MSNNEHEGEALNRIQLSGLWKQESKAGKVYYSGSLGQTTLQLWPNKYKEEGDKRPDLILYIVKRKPKPRPTEQTEGARTDDEVPF